jgi:hypothetical protein
MPSQLHAAWQPNLAIEYTSRVNARRNSAGVIKLFIAPGCADQSVEYLDTVLLAFQCSLNRLDLAANSMNSSQQLAFLLNHVGAFELMPLYSSTVALRALLLPPPKKGAITRAQNCAHCGRSTSTRNGQSHHARSAAVIRC